MEIGCLDWPPRREGPYVVDLKPVGQTPFLGIYADHGLKFGFCGENCIVFESIWKHRRQVFIANLDTGDVRELAPEHEGGCMSSNLLACRDDVVVIADQSVFSPCRVRCLVDVRDLEHGFAHVMLVPFGEVRVPSIDPSFPSLKLSGTYQVVVEKNDGIEAIVYTPDPASGPQKNAPPDASVPVVVLLHGGPHSASPCKIGLLLIPQI